MNSGVFRQRRTRRAVFRQRTDPPAVWRRRAAFRLEGSSMLPVFRPGEVALVRPSGLSAGDCAVYVYEGRTLLHRVMKTGENGAWFCDDAGRLEPHFVPLENIRGKALSRNPLAGGLCGHLYSRLRRSLSPLFT